MMNRLSEVLNPERQVMAGQDVRLSSHTGALSEQGSAPSFQRFIKTVSALVPGVTKHVHRTTSDDMPRGKQGTLYPAWRHLAIALERCSRVATKISNSGSELLRKEPRSPGIGKPRFLACSKGSGRMDVWRSQRPREEDSPVFCPLRSVTRGSASERPSVQSRGRIVAPSFDLNTSQGRHSQCSPTIGNILAIVVAVLIGLFIAMSLLDGPYWPRIDDTTGVAR